MLSKHGAAETAAKGTFKGQADLNISSGTAGS